MKKESCSTRLKRALKINGMKQAELSSITKIPKSAISQYVSGAFEPKQDRVELIAEALNVSEAWLMGFDVPMEREHKTFADNFPSPNITEEYTTFPVIGDVAAGYDHIAIESWNGDVVDIPDSYLLGHSKSDFFVLRVVGDSMYPLYQNGDKVLILKQETLNESGDVGVIIYDNEIATLKKIEYAKGEDWLRLVPINPIYKPELIEGSQLECCRVIGVPRLLIREID
ncbi:MAG: helix-turn-helix domain-containing protein [Clostridiales bacterium]|nr:helix-turn-helix domain-containing protein [Clostridiales bacterium]